MYLLIALLVVLLILGYYYISWNSDHWKKLGVPYDEPTIFFGNFLGVLSGKKHFSLLYTDLYRKYKKYPYCGFFKMRDPGLVINDLDLVRTVLIKDSGSFIDNDFQVDPESDHIWAANAFVQTGEVWKKTRSVWTSSLTVAKIKTLYEDIEKTGKIMVETLRKQIGNHPNEPFDARLLTSQFFTDAIVRSLFRLEVNSFEDPTNPFLEICESLLATTFLHEILTMVFLLAPALGSLFKIRIISKSTERKLYRVSKEIIEQRKNRGYQKNNPFDSVLLHSGGNTATVSEVVETVFNFMVDGAATASGVGGFVLYSLASNPDVQKELADKIDDAYSSNDGQVSFEIINSITYLDMIISETLRMYPAFMSAQRFCTKDYEFPPVTPGGKPIRVTKGTTIVIPVLGFHMDPELYPNPEKFDPERFSDDNKANIPKYGYLPFGDGPRTCLGMRFAINQMKMMLVSLMRNFEIRLTPDLVDRPLEVDPQVFLYRHRGNLSITLHDRNVIYK